MIDPGGTGRLVEEALTAWRPRAGDGRILPHPAWADLPAPERERLFEEAMALRGWERAVDPEGVSGTCRAVLARIRNAAPRAD